VAVPTVNPGLHVSLFGGIFKAVGKVARAGLSVVTHGASEKILATVKKLGAAKQIANTPDLTAQQQALVNKLGPPLSPTTKRTEVYLGDLQARVNEGGKKMPGRAKKKPKPYVGAPVLKAPKVKKPRAAPKGGLDLKAISALWQSQGKPGRWVDFIKANPIRKA
jgi:hypothetical protein